MCLGDAGYALVMLGVIGWLFKKYRRIFLLVKDFVTLFAFCAVSTFVYGVISGSFFGNFIDSFLPFLVPLKNSLLRILCLLLRRDPTMRRSPLSGPESPGAAN